MSAVVLAASACGGRTPLLEQAPSSAAGAPAAGGADGGQASDTPRGGPDARQNAIDSDVPREARFDRPQDAPTSSPDLGVDRSIDTRLIDTRPDAAVDSSRANDVASRELGMEAGSDGGPTLKLVAGGLGGTGHQDGTLALAKFRIPYGIASDSTGHLFVAESGYGVIRKIDIASGTVTTLAGSILAQGSADGVGASAQFNDVQGIVCDDQGNLFVADFSASTIRKIVIATGAVTTLAGRAGVAGYQDGTGAAARFDRPMGVTLDGTGNLFVADFGNNVVRKIVIATGEVTTLAGTAGVIGGKDGIGAAAQFSSPWGVAADRAGHLYLTDPGNQSIRTIAIAGGAATTLVSSIDVPESMDAGTSTLFKGPRAIVYDDTGNLYVSDGQGYTVRKVAIASGAVTFVAGTPGISGNRDGAGAEAQFGSLSGMAMGPSRELFVADSYGNVIRKVVPSTGAVSLYAGSYPQTGSVDGTGADARFNTPRGVVSDGEGHLFVADSGNYTLRKVVAATGVVTTLAGMAGEKGCVDGRGTAARFWALRSVVSDQAGNLLVSDGNSVRKVGVATGEVTTLAGSCEQAGDLDGVGTSALFRTPRGLHYDGAGTLFVADIQNHTIRRIVVATGQVSTLPCWEGDDTPDGGVASPFSSPWGLTGDGAGHLFVSETGYKRVRQVDLATGKVTTLAGQRGEIGYVDGIGEAARFRYPSEIVSDGAGGLLVADLLNHVIRRIDLATRAVTTVLGDPEQNGVALSPLRPLVNYLGGLALGPAGQIFITTTFENAVLVARF